jgi:hypothetical protein
MCRTSVAGVAARSGLDGPEINLVERGFRPPSPLYNWYRVSFLGLKRSGCVVDHPPLSSREIKERVELYFSYPSGSS